MQIQEIFEGIFRIDRKLATINIVKGKRVYDEELISHKGTEYRSWNPYRSKLAAAILNGMKNMRIKSGSKVLYLGAASGTTSSHVSDIVGKSGAVFCVEISERSMRDLLKVCELRTNMLPIFNDARMIDEYKEEVGIVDVLYQDVSSRDQADILLGNSEVLKKGGFAYVAIKSQSIDVSKKPSEVYKTFLNSISVKFKVLEKLDISPYDKYHLFVVLQKQ